jgi:hypothetical protein
MTDKVAKYIGECFHLIVRPVGALALVYALGAFLGGVAVDEWKDARHARTERIADIARDFNDTSAEFDALVAATANGIMDSGKANPADKTKLVVNLNRQYTEIEEIAPIVKSEEAIAKYKRSLSDLNATLPTVNDVQSMRAYWTGVSEVLAARRDLRTQLSKRAGLYVD